MNDHSKSALKPLLVGLIVFLWLGLLMGAYFWAHKPFDTTNPAIGRSLGITALNIIAWVGVIWLAAAWGRWLFHRPLADEDGVPRLVLFTGVGLGLISIVMGILGLVGAIHPLAAWGLLILLLVLLRQHIPAVLAEVRAIKRPQPTTRFQRFILWYGAITLGLTFLIALAPVTAFDSLTYHLTGPRFYIEAGRLVHPVDIPHLGFPLLGQMQFTLGMLLVGDGVAALFHYGYGLLTIALTAVLARRTFGVSAAWFAVMVLLTIPTLFTLMSWPYVDVTLMFYTTAVFYTFVRWREQRANWAWLLLMGMMMGFSGGLKYTAVATPVAVTLSLVWESRRDGAVTILKRLLLMGGTAVILVLPWLIENGITTGNPVYPFFFEDGLYWDAWRAWWYDLPGTGLAATAPWRLLLVPLEATIVGTEGTDFYEATIGPFILGVLFLLPFVWRYFQEEEKRVLKHMLLFFAVNYALWLNGIARTALLLRARFVFLAFGVTAVIGGLILSRLKQLKRPELDIAWLSQTILTLTLALLLFTQIMTFLDINPLPVVVGLEAEADYMRRRLGVYPVVMEELNALPPGSEVVFLWETRSYPCQAVLCHPDPILDKFLHLTQFYEYDAAAMAQAWQAEGITHVLWYKAGYDFLLNVAEFNPIGGHIGSEDQAVLQALQATYLSVVGEWADAYVLYELNADGR